MQSVVERWRRGVCVLPSPQLTGIQRNYQATVSVKRFGGDRAAQAAFRSAVAFRIADSSRGLPSR